MWTAALASSVFLGMYVCSTWDNNGLLSAISSFSSKSEDNIERKLVKRAAAGLDLHHSNGSFIGYYFNRSVISYVKNNITSWYVLDWPDGPMLINYEHPLNIYDDIEQLKALKEGVPVFVRAENKKWFKITDPPAELRKYLVNEVLVYLSNDFPKLGPEDFKPAKVEFYGDRLFAPEDIASFKKREEKKAAI